MAACTGSIANVQFPRLSHTSSYRQKLPASAERLPWPAARGPALFLAGSPFCSGQQVVCSGLSAVARPQATPQQRQQLPSRVVRAQVVKETYSTFEGMLAAAEEPVLVDFYAVWCGPCQLMSGVLQEVANQRQGRLKIVKIDTEKYPQLASTYGVEALPTLILFHRGQQVHRLEGALPAADLLKAVDAALASAP